MRPKTSDHREEPKNATFLGVGYFTSPTKKVTRFRSDWLPNPGLTLTKPQQNGAVLRMMRPKTCEMKKTPKIWLSELVTQLALIKIVTKKRLSQVQIQVWPDQNRVKTEQNEAIMETNNEDVTCKMGCFLEVSCHFNFGCVMVKNRVF